MPKRQNRTLTLTGMYNLLTEYHEMGREQAAGIASLADAHATSDGVVSAAYG